MGVWGFKNFESDYALNTMADLTNQLIEQIREIFNNEPDNDLFRRGESEIIVNVDILGTLLSHYEFYSDLEVEEVEKWKDSYISMYDNITSDWDPEFKRNRRIIIIATFDRLLKIMTKLLNDSEF